MNNLNELLNVHNNGLQLSFNDRLLKITEIINKEIPRSKWPGELKALLSGEIVYVRPLFQLYRPATEEEHLDRIRGYIEKILFK